MKKFVCSVCGYVHTAEELAADFKCPVCKVPASKFVEQKGEQKLAAVHEYGVYAQTVNSGQLLLTLLLHELGSGNLTYGALEIGGQLIGSVNVTTNRAYKLFHKYFPPKF